ncbi:hypothetical protein [Microbulbifer sp. SAOS-129_SWC]|uniref:hypothetical protein n=1 Tax=Microbulbifer sp. SAOS-129_SWC TaxID=3145235 RepID=UPI003216B67D
MEGVNAFPAKKTRKADLPGFFLPNFCRCRPGGAARYKLIKTYLSQGEAGNGQAVVAEAAWFSPVNLDHSDRQFFWSRYFFYGVAIPGDPAL